MSIDLKTQNCLFYKSHPSLLSHSPSSDGFKTTSAAPGAAPGGCRRRRSPQGSPRSQAGTHGVSLPRAEKAAAAAKAARATATRTPAAKLTRELLRVLLQVGCVGLVFACNAVMWTFFAKALRYSSSSATATVTTTASNFLSSAFLGKLLFGETHTLLWWAGITMTLCGLLLLHTAPSQSEQIQSEKKDK
ncbi:transmembrane protein 42 [Alligator sinensis]|uniref:Transmembrane protein 42 n=1 Tax=Alligator sinensis TaxID=38654 RepID=A0A3Q0G8U8_ALLSI|nr:transmembrane protein 42 [Alligator sinensis]